MTSAEVTRLKSELYPEEKWNSVSVRSRVNAADLSVNELDDIISSLGGVLCDCSPIRHPLGPMGKCDLCGVVGPFYEEAVKSVSERREVRPYKTVSLAETFKKGVPAPVLLCDGLLYEGGLHSLAGAPDCGKTTLALFWAVQLLREGKPVLFMDEEGGEEIVVEKLTALGAGPAELELITYVPFPGRSWSDEDIEELVHLARDNQVAMMLVDSSAAFLARAGLDENSAPAVTSWWSRVLTPIARDVRACVLVIDHDVKSSEISRYARGSGAKLAALDVQLKATLVQPFTREQEGNLKLVITKDRRGWLHRHWNIDVHTGRGIISPEFSREDPDTKKAAPDNTWPPSRKALYEQLTSTPQTSQQLVDAIVDAGGIPLKRETRSRELNKLAEDGYADRVEVGQGREALWSLPVTSRVDHGSEENECPFLYCAPNVI